MENPLEQLHEYDEMRDCIEKYFQLAEQKKTPTRDGMIKALSDAQTIAYSEIKNVERNQGETIPTPWQNISNDDFYRKLTQYQQGILNHCVNKFGESVFRHYLESLQP